MKIIFYPVAALAVYGVSVYLDTSIYLNVLLFGAFFILMMLTERPKAKTN